MKEIIKRVINFFIAQKANATLWYASRQADKAYAGKMIIGYNKDKSPRYARGNTRYYVMPDHDDKLICMSRHNFKKLRTKGRMSEEAKVKHLTSESFYYTPHANGLNPLSNEWKRYKRRKYIEYCIVKYNEKRKRKRTIRMARKKMKKR